MAPIINSRLKALRREWCVEEPELHKYPSWIRWCVAAAIKRGDLPRPYPQDGSLRDTYRTTQYVLSILGDDWFDHAGQLHLLGLGRVLISEPYHLSDEGRSQLERFCSVLGLRYRVEERSWWCPPYTMRIVIWKPRSSD